MSHPLKRIASRISGLYKQNQRAWIFLFCLLLAAVFWTFNSLNRTYVHTLYCPLTEGASGDTLALTLEGKGFDLFSLLSNDSLPVRMPAPETYFGRSVVDTVPQEVAAEKFIDFALLKKHKITLVSVSPQVIVPAQQTVSARRVPVKLRLEEARGLFPQLDHGPIIVQPDSVNVFGPYAVIRTIGEVSTRPAPYPNEAGISFSGVYLDNPQPEKVRLSSKYVWMYCKVSELTEGSVTLPVRSSGVGGRYKLVTVPAEVRLIYHATTSEIGNIGPGDFSVSASIDEAHTGKRAVLVLEKKPEAARHVRIVPGTVEYYLVEQL